LVVEAPAPVVVDAPPGPEVLVVDPLAVEPVVRVESLLLLLELPQPAASASATSAGVSHGKRRMFVLLRPLGLARLPAHLLRRRSPSLSRPPGGLSMVS
jgi:hypothetical protein